MTKYYIISKSAMAQFFGAFIELFDTFDVFDGIYGCAF